LTAFLVADEPCGPSAQNAALSTINGELRKSLMPLSTIQFSKNVPFPVEQGRSVCFARVWSFEPRPPFAFSSP